MEHDFVQRVVLDDPPPRQVLLPRLGLAPAGERLQSAEHGGVPARKLEPLPRVFRREGEARRVGEPFHLLVEPGAAAGLFQLLDHSREDRGEVGDVGDRIIDLALVERAAAPVGEARALVEAVPEQALDQVRIADLLAMAERHRRDLRVEQRMRDLAGQIVDDLEVLAAGVEDLQHVLILHEQVEQGLQVDALGLGIDRRGFLGARDLDQAEIRPIGVLAHELGVHGDEGLGGETVDESLEVVRLGNQRMDTHEFAGL